MPARSTVVSVLSKRTDRGVGPLSVAQLLQMAGRAGRRGKDVQVRFWLIAMADVCCQLLL
jgi:superfamily II RNA helicase